MADPVPFDSKKPFLQSQTHLSPARSPPASPSPPPQYDAADYRKCWKLPRCTAWLPSRHAVNKFWVIESLAGVFSIILFSVIVALLAVYDTTQYSATSLTHESEIKRATIFPILSILSTIMRACMLLPVATCIGQLKWSWFRSRRRLVDVERFDEASRGITGSLVLLWTVRFRHLVAVGAALTILALPLDALIQSAVLLPQKRQLNTVPYPRSDLETPITNITTLPRTNVYSQYRAGESDDDPWAATSMLNAVKFGVSYMTGLDNTAGDKGIVDCPTGYCDFGQFQTLAIKHRCIDRSNDIQEEGADHYPYLTLPDTDLRLYHKGGMRNGTGSYQQMLITAQSYPDQPTNTTDIKLPALIARTAMIVKPRDGAGLWDKAVAVECSLRWSLRTLSGEVDQATSSSVIENPLNETTMAGSWDVNDDPANKNLAFVLEPTTGCWVNNTAIFRGNNTLYNEECLYRITKKAHQGIQKLLCDSTDGLVGDYILVSRNETADKNYLTRMNHFINNINTLMTENRTAYISNLEGVFQNIAWSMTRVARVDSGVDPKFALGLVYSYVFVYHVIWSRLAFPAIVVFSCNVFFIVTAVLTAGDYGWRRSNLPLVFHGLGGVEGESRGPVKELADMEAVAEKMIVRLGETPEGARLMSAHTT